MRQQFIPRNACCSSATLCLLMLSLSPVLSQFDSSFLDNFSFWPFCRNSWTCHNNWDGSITMSCYYGSSGGFSSNRLFFYGVFSVRMKLPVTPSGGVVHAYYLQQQNQVPNNDTRHAEIDIELIGGANPSDRYIATNIIVGGYQYLEQHKFPMDPASDFHTYTIIWTASKITWMVDATPIRVTMREDDKPWPAEPLRVMGSIWDGSSWTKQQSDFRPGPVAVQMRDFKLDACSLDSALEPFPPCAGDGDDAGRARNAQLTDAQSGAYEWFKTMFLVKSWGWEKWYESSTPG